MELIALFIYLHTQPTCFCTYNYLLKTAQWSKMGTTWPLFVYFRSFRNTMTNNFAQNLTIKETSIVGLLGI